MVFCCVLGESVPCVHLTGISQRFLISAPVAFPTGRYEVKIAYLHQYFITPGMGGATRSYELARRLVAAGHEVHMVTSDQSSERDQQGWRFEELDGIKVHWTQVHYSNELGFWGRLLAFFAFAWRAAGKVPELDADIVYATSTPLTVALPAVWAARRKRIPMVFEVRDLWPAVPIAMGVIRNPIAIKAARWLERFAYRNASRVIALAPGMKDAVVETGYPDQKVVVIPNGADLNAFSLDANARRRTREQYAWLGERRMVLYFGALGVVNGVDYLIRMAAEIKILDPEVRFVVLGEGRCEQELRELGEELGVLGSNLYMLGKVPKKEVARWLATSDMSIALITGPRVLWKDATQNKFFDSLAAGRPVANNFDGWQSQIAQSTGCGLILDSTDIPRAAQQLYDVLSDDEWLSAAGAVARKLAEGTFNRDTQAQKLESVLENVLHEGD